MEASPPSAAVLHLCAADAPAFAFPPIAAKVLSGDRACSDPPSRAETGARGRAGLSPQSPPSTRFSSFSTDRSSPHAGANRSRVATSSARSRCTRRWSSGTRASPKSTVLGRPGASGRSRQQMTSRSCLRWGERLGREPDALLRRNRPRPPRPRRRCSHASSKPRAIEIPVLEPLGGIRMPAGLPAHCSSASVRDDSTARSSRPDGAHRGAEKRTDSLRDLGLCLP